MAAGPNELQSFVNKFINLWQSGCEASLVLETKAGNAYVNLKLGLGQAPIPPYAGGHGHRGGGPARQRRSAKREAERQARVIAEQAVTAMAENARSKVQAEKADLIEAEKAVIFNSEQKEAEHEEEISEKDVISEKESILIDKSENEFNCEICDFTSNWKNGLEIHMTRNHSSVEQLDGNVTIDDDVDEEYTRTRHYWKSGWLGSVYQCFLDANQIIDNSNLKEEVKELEKEKILDARKLAFGNNFMYNPPWSNR